MIRAMTYITVLVVAVFVSANADAQRPEDWAACIVAEAPVSGKNWLDLGGPKSKLSDDHKKRASNLSFRLKAICSRKVAQETEFDAVRFDANSVYDALRRLNKKAPLPSNAVETPFFAAGVCSMYFLAVDLEKVGDDPKLIDRRLLAGAGMSFTGFDLINPELPNPSLVSATQSNGAPVKTFRECKRITSDGSLTNA